MLVTDAWEPQVNGVVRTMKRVIAETEAMGHEWDIVSPNGFKKGNFQVADLRGRIPVAPFNLRPDSHAQRRGPVLACAQHWVSSSGCCSFSHGLLLALSSHHTFSALAVQNHWVELIKPQPDGSQDRVPALVLPMEDQEWFLLALRYLKKNPTLLCLAFFEGQFQNLRLRLPQNRWMTVFAAAVLRGCAELLRAQYIRGVFKSSPGRAGVREPDADEEILETCRRQFFTHMLTLDDIESFLAPDYLENGKVEVVQDRWHAGSAFDPRFDRHAHRHRPVGTTAQRTAASFSYSLSIHDKSLASVRRQKRTPDEIKDPVLLKRDLPAWCATG